MYMAKKKNYPETKPQNSMTEAMRSCLYSTE